MNSAPVLIQHDLDKKFIEEMEQLRFIRIGLAEKQLENLEETAKGLIDKGLDESANNELFLQQLKAELIKKVNELKERTLNKEVFFADEISFYLSIAEEAPEPTF